jgi:predicted metal-dependent hydrolase
MERPDLRDAYLEGIRLFNARQYWHAHEQWEACWLDAQEPDATFYKAIIQTAAALVKWQQGNLRGLKLNWAKSRTRLETLPTPFHGLDLQQLCVCMDQLVNEPDAQPPVLEPGEHGPGAP